MSGGPYSVLSAHPITAAVAFAYVYKGAGSTNDTTSMLGIGTNAVVTADVVAWHVVIPIPLVLPSGIAKLEILSRTPVESGVTALNIRWKSVAKTESPDDAVLLDEGSVDIIANLTGDQYTRTLLNLDADAVIAGEIIHMDVEVDDSAHTIADNTGLLLALIFED